MKIFMLCVFFVLFCLFVSLVYVVFNSILYCFYDLDIGYGVLCGFLLLLCSVVLLLVVLLVVGFGFIDCDGNNFFGGNNCYLLCFVEVLVECGIVSVCYDKCGVVCSLVVVLCEEDFSVGVYVDDVVVWSEWLVCDLCFFWLILVGYSEGVLIVSLVVFCMLVEELIVIVGSG